MDIEIIIKICLFIVNNFENIGIIMNVFIILGLYKSHIDSTLSKFNQKGYNNKEEESKVDLDKTETDNQKENLNSQLENFNTEKEHNNLFNVIDELTTDFKDYLNKFLEDSNIFEFLMNFMNNIIDLYSQLSIEQLNALNSLNSSIVILICTLNIISVLFPNYFLNFLKLENKFQKLTDIFKFRNDFNRISLIFYLLIIVFMTLGLIYINILILYY
jgi:hypothetical protein